MSLASWIGKKVKLTDGSFWSAFLGLGTWSGKTVTTETALQLATVWACIRITAQAASVLPLQLYEKEAGGGRRPVRDDHPLYNVLELSPNDDQTPGEFWEGLVAWLLANGNAYAEKKLSRDRLVALQPFASDQVYPYRNSDNELFFRVTDRGKTDELPDDKVLHLKGFGFGGDLGLSAIRYGAQTFGSALATDESAAKLFANGLQAAGVLSSEQTLKPDQRKQLQKIMETYTGSQNANKLMILEAGLKFESVTLNPEDAQMLETRRFAIEEICRWFGVPPIIIGHAGQGQTMWGSGVEQILIAWLTLGLNPILRRIEQRISKQLIATGERRRIYAEFNREGLLQADTAAKSAFLSTMVQNALMSRNEARAKLNLPRDPSGDQLTAQSNLLPLERLGEANAGSEQVRSAFRSWLGIEEGSRDDAA